MTNEHKFQSKVQVIRNTVYWQASYIIESQSFYSTDVVPIYTPVDSSLDQTGPNGDQYRDSSVSILLNLNWHLKCMYRLSVLFQIKDEERNNGKIMSCFILCRVDTDDRHERPVGSQVWSSLDGFRQVLQQNIPEHNRRTSPVSDIGQFSEIWRFRVELSSINPYLWHGLSYVCNSSKNNANWYRHLEQQNCPI